MGWEEVAMGLAAFTIKLWVMGHGVYLILR